MRRKTVTVRIGQVNVGSTFPVVVQSMTNTDTADTVKTVEQIVALHHAGSELVGLHNEERPGRYLKSAELDKRCPVPVIGDYYNGHLLLTRFPNVPALANTALTRK
jgi:(E)-4-hydroxy-3-methylbut-2-enyl-diphosphate synthase